MIRLHDTLRRAVVPLETREPGRVAMYVCGPTVYNYIHVGNARTFVWFDMVARYLRYRGLEVTYVMNYTDIDDKIIERARIEGVPPEGITSKYSAAFERDMASLGVRGPDILVRATDHIEDMIKAIAGLIEQGHAYEAGGDVWFAVESLEGYGKLSHRSLEDMRAGERVEPHPGKRHPLDFSLWKAAKEGEPAWPSPWGPGRPGWHIECSVMSTKYLGMGFDLHGGASDLVFPHHENEIAQAEALHKGSTFVRHWLHTGLVQMGDEKMSKSLGNIVLAHEAVARFGGEVLRYWMLSAAPRTQVRFSEGTLEDARQAYERWLNFARATRHALGDQAPRAEPQPTRPFGLAAAGAGAPFVHRFVEALDDDLNSPEAFAALHDLVRAGNRLIESALTGDEAARAELGELGAAFAELTHVLGFGFEAGESSSELVDGLVGYLLELREQARRERAFERADEIRERLAALGVVIEDTPAGPRWRHAGS
jgi:cysteinyl-tRNA synthetase